MPTLQSPGEMIPGQFGPMSRTPCRGHELVRAQHVARRDPLGDADDEPDPRAAASMIASAANDAGTKITEVFALVCPAPHPRRC